MTDYDPHYQPQPEHSEHDHHDGFEQGHRGEPEHDSQPDDDHGREPAEHAGDPSPPVKKRGPKPMTDRPTVRFEGQLYEEQYNSASAIVNRLKVENRSVPSGDRRRMTINTLARIGMTIVLEHETALHGKSEDELLAALRQSISTHNEGSNA